jgi:hypothetical protein
MTHRLFASLAFAGVLTIPMAAQPPDGFLDIQVAKVKMGRRAEFDAINKRFAEINRKNGGDQWLAYETWYGGGNTVYFVSSRRDYAGVADALNAFQSALTKALGPAGMSKILNDWDSTVESEQMQLRRRRWDLSAGAPPDAASYNRIVGQARYLRMAIVRVRPGRLPAFEGQLKIAKAAQDRANEGFPTFVSQSEAGQPVGTFYITTLLKTLADLDKVKPLQEVLGPDYDRYQAASAENTLGTEIMIGRFLPELSNAPEEIAAIDPKFWRPTPPAGAK